MTRNRPGYTSENCLNCGRPSGGRSRCKECMAMTTAANRKRRKRYREAGGCSLCGKPAAADLCDVCLNRTRNRHNIVRLECIMAYGGVCACCGEEHPEFLQIDHMGNDGHIERADARTNGLPQSIYRRLKKQGYPPGFQVLCANCNMALAFYGRCPHRPEHVRLIRGRFPPVLPGKPVDPTHLDLGIVYDDLAIDSST